VYTQLHTTILWPHTPLSRMSFIQRRLCLLSSMGKFHCQGHKVIKLLHKRKPREPTVWTYSSHFILCQDDLVWTTFHAQHVLHVPEVRPQWHTTRSPDMSSSREVFDLWTRITLLTGMSFFQNASVSGVSAVCGAISLIYNQSQQHSFIHSFMHSLLHAFRNRILKTASLVPGLQRKWIG